MKSRPIQSSSSQTKILKGCTPCPHYHGLGEILGKSIQRWLTLLSVLFQCKSKCFCWLTVTSRGTKATSSSQQQLYRVCSKGCHRTACPLFKKLCVFKISQTQEITPAPSFIKMSTLPDACKDYLIVSQRVWHPTDHGESAEQGSSLPYPAPSFLSGKQSLTDGLP